MRMQTAQSTLSAALRREYHAAALPTLRLLFLDGPKQTQGLDCFGFAALALCCRKHDRLILFDTTEALLFRDWVALLLVETGAPGTVNPTAGQHLALPPEVVSGLSVPSMAGTLPTPTPSDDCQKVLPGLEQAGPCATGAVNGRSWTASPTVVDAALSRNDLPPKERSSRQESLAEGGGMPSGSRAGEGSADALTH
eukprot:1883573-Rhodomonas_salina.1